MNGPLVKANKCLHVIRALRKEGFNQKETDLLFNSLVIPTLSYGLPVYGAAEPELTTIQSFLDRCFKRKFFSERIDVHNRLEQSDKKIFRKVAKLDNYPLNSLLHKKKLTSYNLRRLSSTRQSQYKKIHELFCK